MHEQPNRPLPKWLMVAGSIGIAVHLVALVILSVASQSGPWWLGSLGMPSQAEEPEFARGMHTFLGDVYYRPLHLTNNYHFISNMPERTTVRFEVNVLDENGTSIKKVMFPDPNANFWVRHRQSLLAQGLGDDRPTNLPESERVPNPERKVWHPARGDQKLGSHPENRLIDERNAMRKTGDMMGFMQPSPWSEVLAASYARHVAHVYGGAKAEIIRMSREPINPAIVLPVAPPKNLFDRSFKTLVSNFGAYSRDQ
jgi:hypothetical protein